MRIEVVAVESEKLAALDGRDRQQPSSHTLCSVCENGAKVTQARSNYFVGFARATTASFPLLKRNSIS